jgi:hypothetical protein
MKPLYPLRPIQIIDTSFVLSKKTFVRFFFIGLIFMIPLQVIAWILEVAADNQSSDLEARTLLISAIFQCFIIGISLVFTSNVFGTRVSKEFCREYLGKVYPTTFNSTRIRIFIIQLLYQLCSLILCILTRFILGRITDNDRANSITVIFLILYVAIWSGLTLRQSFAIPISINENASGKNLRDRLKTLNRASWLTLFGTFCYCWLLIIVIAIPMVTILQFVVSKDFIQSSVGELALLNLIFTFLVSFICVIYSFILITTYFNSRVLHEGFDLAITIDEIDQTRRNRGKLLDTYTR